RIHHRGPLKGLQQVGEHEARLPHGPRPCGASRTRHLCRLIRKADECNSVAVEIVNRPCVTLQKSGPNKWRQYFHDALLMQTLMHDPASNIWRIAEIHGGFVALWLRDRPRISISFFRTMDSLF